MKKYRITSATQSQRGVSLTISVTEIVPDGVLVEADDTTQSKKFVISKKKFTELGITTYAINAEMYSRIAEAHVLNEAITKGVDLLSYSDKNPEQIKRKLIEKGYPRETAEEAASELAETGLIREDVQAQRAAEVLARKMRGPSRIKSELYQKGFSSEVISEAIAHVEESCDFDEICAKLIIKKFGEIPKDSGERRKMVQFLVRSGFSGSNIREAEKLVKDE